MNIAYTIVRKIRDAFLNISFFVPLHYIYLEVMYSLN